MIRALIDIVVGIGLLFMFWVPRKRRRDPAPDEHEQGGF